MSTNNLCFEKKYEKCQNFYLKIFLCLVVKFSLYLNRRCFRNGLLFECMLDRILLALTVTRATSENVKWMICFSNISQKIGFDILFNFSQIEKICIKCQSLFLKKKNKKTIIKCPLLIFFTQYAKC